MDQSQGLHLGLLGIDLLEEIAQVVGVLRDGFVGNTGGGGTDNEGALAGAGLLQELFQPHPFPPVLDLAGNPDVAPLGHHHQVSTREADVGRQSRPLGADGVFLGLHLDQNLIPVRSVADVDLAVPARVVGRDQGAGDSSSSSESSWSRSEA